MHGDLGKLRRFQLRTRWEPWIATGTTVAPDCRASLPMPGLGRSASSPCATARPRST